jgi:hypothetical protein
MRVHGLIHFYDVCNMSLNWPLGKKVAYETLKKITVTGTHAKVSV